MDGEAHGWAWKPYGWFDPAPRPRDITRTYFYRRRPRLRLSGAPQEEGKREVRLCGETLLPSPSLAWLMCLSRGLSRAIVVFSGAALPAACSCLEVGPVWPAGGAAEGAELGCGASGAA